MEKIIGWYLEQRLQNNSRVNIIKSDYYEFIFLNVCGYNIIGAHGDLEKFKQYILELKEKYYIKVATGKPSEDSDIEKAMREIGVRTEQLWIKKKDTLSLNSKFAKVEQYIES